jgi:hypothetical protein
MAALKLDSSSGTHVEKPGKTLQNDDKTLIEHELHLSKT